MKTSKWKILAAASVIATIALFPSAALAAKYALVIGINGYKNLPGDKSLKTAVNDAHAIGALMTSFGYQVTAISDTDKIKPDRISIERTWIRLLGQLHENDTLVVAYSGHGIEVSGQNYLVPGDVANLAGMTSMAELKPYMISIPDKMEELRNKNLAAAIWILDACRDNPFSDPTRALGGSALKISPTPGPTGQFVFYSAGRLETALDSLPTDKILSDSVFNRVFTKQVQQFPHKSTVLLAKDIQVEVRHSAAPHLQLPAYYDEIEGYWCFQDCGDAAPRVVVSKVQTTTQTRSIFGNVAAFFSTSTITNSSQSSFTEEIQPQSHNAVFIGKRSASDNCDRKVSDRFPFGCSALRDAKTSESDNQATPRTLKAETAVNIRSSIPTIAATQKIPSCVVSTAQTGAVIKISSVVALNYTGETYYWGLIDAPPKACNVKSGKS